MGPPSGEGNAEERPVRPGNLSLHHAHHIPDVHGLLHYTLDDDVSAERDHGDGGWRCAPGHWQRGGGHRVDRAAHRELRLVHRLPAVGTARLRREVGALASVAPPAEEGHAPVTQRNHGIVDPT